MNLDVKDWVSIKVIGDIRKSASNRGEVNVLFAEVIDRQIDDKSKVDKHKEENGARKEFSDIFPFDETTSD